MQYSLFSFLGVGNALFKNVCKNENPNKRLNILKYSQKNVHKYIMNRFKDSQIQGYLENTMCTYYQKSREDLYKYLFGINATVPEKKGLIDLLSCSAIFIESNGTQTRN